MKYCIRHLLVFGCVLLGACTTVSSGARDIQIVHDEAHIPACAFVGSVVSTPPYGLPGEDLTQLKNQAAVLGANVIVQTGARSVVTRGMAYRCTTF